MDPKSGDIRHIGRRTEPGATRTRDLLLRNPAYLQIKARIRRAAKARNVTLPDPDEFVKVMDRVRKKRK